MVACLCAQTIWAQGVQTSTLRGIVSSADGRGLPGVTVSVTSAAFFLIVNGILLRAAPLASIEQRRGQAFYLQGILLFGTFPFAIIMRAVLGDHSEIALAMAGVAAFAVLPLLLAAVLGLRSQTHS